MKVLRCLVFRRLAPLAQLLTVGILCFANPAVGGSAPFPADIPIDSLSTATGVRFLGAEPDHEIGKVLSNAGDLNADGIEDLLVGSRADSILGHTGKAYLLFGRPDYGSSFPPAGPGPVIGLDTMDRQTGIAIVGEDGDLWTWNRHLGEVVAGGFDLNADGFSDVVVRGRATSNAASVEVLFVLFGQADWGQAGGPAQLMINDAFIDGDRAMAVVLEAWNPAIWETPGTQDVLPSRVTERSESANARSGGPLDSDDLNGDGIDDLLFIASDNDSTVRVLYGSTQYGKTGGPREILESNLVNDPAAAVAITVHNNAAATSFRVINDVSGDGRSDLLIGADGQFPANSDGTERGESYLVFGWDNGFAGLNLGDLDGASTGTRFIPRTHLFGNNVNENDLGRAVAGGYDVNDDGCSDILFSAPTETRYTTIPGVGTEFIMGVVYLIYGTCGPLFNNADFINLSDLDVPGFGWTAGMAIFDTIAAGQSDGPRETGTALTTVPDMNGDGIADIVIADYRWEHPTVTVATGRVYVVFGSPDFGSGPNAGQPDLSFLHLANLDGNNGFTITSDDNDGFARSLASADLNGDGLRDVVIGTPFEDSESGGLYVVYGRDVAAPPVDTDLDGWLDSSDNCTVDYNPGQQDADADGFGNACDADFNNDCVINFLDLGIMKDGFFTSDPLLDLNSDGWVNFIDLGVMKRLFFLPPGPSGEAQICL